MSVGVVGGFMSPMPGRMPRGPGWIYELKWDGIRAAVTTTVDGELSVHTRRGLDITVAFPELQGLAEIPGQLARLDVTTAFALAADYVDTGRRPERVEWEPLASSSAAS